MSFTKSEVYDTLKDERGEVLNSEFTMQKYTDGYDIKINKFGLLRGVTIDTDAQKITITYTTVSGEETTEAVSSIPELLNSLQSYNHEVKK